MKFIFKITSTIEKISKGLKFVYCLDAAFKAFNEEAKKQGLLDGQEETNKPTERG